MIEHSALQPLQHIHLYTVNGITSVFQIAGNSRGDHDTILKIYIVQFGKIKNSHLNIHLDNSNLGFNIVSEILERDALNGFTRDKVVVWMIRSEVLSWDELSPALVTVPGSDGYVGLPLITIVKCSSLLPYLSKGDPQIIHFLLTMQSCIGRQVHNLKLQFCNTREQVSLKFCLYFN